MNSVAQPTANTITPRSHPVHIPGEPILRVEHLSLAYEGVVALQDVTFQLITGERMAVIGPNGAGKSTLFKIIAGLLKPGSGTVSVFGDEPSGHICISYLPQHNHVDWNFPVTVGEVVMMGRTRKIGFFRWPSASDREIVSRALRTVGLHAHAHRQISQLSGGQQQRMFIARALAQEADLMLMDEPVTGLDTPSQEELFTVLDTLREEKVTVMFALHDLKLAASSFDRVMLLNRRLVGIGKPAEVFTREHLSNAYGDRAKVLENGHGLSMVDDTCCSGRDE
jgi:ABC-type Mn2+/Zn2+ transport system ATPase subunit